MFGNDHNPPHFHVVYNEYRALIEIETGEVLQGSLPGRQLKMVQVWADIHTEELMINFNNLRAEIQTFSKIQPLQQKEDNMKWIVKIMDVEPYKITCLWNNKEVRTIDLKSFIDRKESKPNNSYFQLLNKDRFYQVKCDGTTIYWEDGLTMKELDGTEKLGPLDIDPDFLYEMSFKDPAKIAEITDN